MGPIASGGLLQWLSGKESAYNSEDTGDAGVWKISVSGRSPGGKHGNPLQFSCPEIPMDRGAWHKVAKNWTWLKQLSTHIGMWAWDLCPRLFISIKVGITDFVTVPLGFRPGWGWGEGGVIMNFHLWYKSNKWRTSSPQVNEAIKIQTYTYTHPKGYNWILWKTVHSRA